MKRTYVKIGDIFSVAFDEKHQKIFQYIADDLTQLNSSVIRVFRNIYSKEEVLDWNELVKNDVEFYTHAFVRNGIKLGYWQKVGRSSEIGTCDVFFRNSSDYGNPKIEISENWYVWKINQPTVRVGKLEGEYQKAEIGVVISPDSIVHRMKTGKYDFFFPSFNGH